jgi:hypothetical protein
MMSTPTARNFSLVLARNVTNVKNDTPLSTPTSMNAGGCFNSFKNFFAIDKYP